MSNKIRIILFIMLSLIILSGCSIDKNPDKTTSNYSAEETTSSITTESSKEIEYEQKLSFLKESITIDYYIDNDTMVGIFYNSDSDKVFLATITEKLIFISNDELSATTELVPLNNSFALIDYGSQKNIKTFRYNSELQNVFDLTNYYKNSRIRSYSPGEIIISQDGQTICFLVSTLEKDTVYLLDNNSSDVIYEFNKSNAKDNEVSGISRLLCINNRRLYFEGSTIKNGTTTNVSVLGYIDLKDFKLHETLKKSNSSFYSNGSFIYSQDYQISNQDAGSGKISIIDSLNSNISDLSTTYKQESFNCLVSINGIYCCTFEENENSTSINIYNIQSDTLIKNISTNLNITKNTVFIDEENGFLYISSSSDVLKYIEKYEF